MYIWNFIFICKNNLLMKIKLLIPILFFVNFAFSQTPGSIDTSFGNNGLTKIFFIIGNVEYGVRINDTHIFPNGKILAVGNGSSGCPGNGNYYGVILRLNSDGSLDTSFDVDGYQLYVQTPFYDIVSESQNSFYLIASDRVLKIDANGIIDNSYGVNGYASTGMHAREAELNNYGKLIIGGDNGIVNDKTLTISRLNTNGSLDPSFGNSGFFNLSSGWVDPNRLYELKIDNSNRIVCVGKKPISYTRSDVLVFRLDNNGQLDTSFDTDGIYTKSYSGPTGSKTSAFGNDLIIGSNNEITVGAHSGHSMHGVSLLKLNENGTMNNSFGVLGLVNEVISNKALTTRGVHLLNDGSLVTSSEGIDSIFVAKFDASGQLNTSFGNNGYLRYETGGYLPYRIISHSMIDGNQLLLVSYEEFVSCAQSKDLSVFTKIFLGNNATTPTANPATLSLCDLQNDSIESVDLTTAIPQIIGSQSPTGLSVTFHLTMADAQMGTSPLLNTFSVSMSITLYSRVEDVGSGNFAVSTLDLILNPIPTISNPNDLSVMDMDLNGLSIFDLSVNEPIILGSLNPLDFTVSYFESFQDANNNTNPITTLSSYQSITNPQTIYARVENNATACYSLTDFMLISVPVDTDNDGIPDSDEDVNNNGDLTDDDTDGDGISNYQDSDDDGDLVSTTNETTGIGAGLIFNPSEFIDTDGDSVQNYLDADDDGDNVLTKDEDYNNNGSPMDDDTNANGIPDFLDSNVAMSINSIKYVDFKIYPNPTKGELQIQTFFGNGEIEATIYNLQGKELMILKKQAQSNAFQLDLSKFSKGIYLLKIKTENAEILKKIIKL